MPLPRLHLLLGLLLLAGACARSNSGGARTRPPPLVRVASVEARDVPVTVKAPVDLRPLASADVGSKTLGYLDAVLVDRGDRVRKGQLLATVRPSDLPDQLAAERSGLEQIKATAALAQTNFERAQRLAPSGLVSQQELQQATAAWQAAQANEAASRSRIEALAVRLGETRILSPLDGVVASRRLDPGALVGSATGPILSIVQTETLRVFIAVNERESLHIRLGQDAVVELDALPGRSYHGKVARIAPAFDPTTRTIDAEIQLGNPAGELRPGMYGHASIILETHPAAPVLPVEAVVVNEHGAHVFVVEGETVRRRPVELGVDGGEWLEITKGLKVGERVVAAGTEGLADGSRIRIFTDKPAQASKTATAEPGPQRPQP